VGTSGWHYKHWIGDFYPPGFPASKMLAWYAREFQTVEINNSFYRLPDANAFAQWAESVPPSFVFAVKASRYITHIKRLKDPEDPLKLLFSRVEQLGSRLGPVLFQLPPNWKADIPRLSKFLSLLRGRRGCAIEFRDESWYTEEVWELLRRHNVALCLHDWASAPWARELTANFTYIRFHGRNGKYGGNYPDRILRDWAGRIGSWAGRLSEVFAYFNNDLAGHAVRNAKSLRSMFDGP
jgi:uncharacterized protein YecE (DUF72 family)